MYFYDFQITGYMYFYDFKITVLIITFQLFL